MSKETDDFADAVKCIDKFHRLRRQVADLRVIEEYIGDGVYVVFDGYSYILDLRAQDPVLPITKISLEPTVLDGLNNFRKRMESMSKEEIEVATQHLKSNVEFIESDDG